MSLQRHLGHGKKQAVEALILDHWLVAEKDGAAQRLEWLIRQRSKLRSRQTYQPLMAVPKDVPAAGQRSADCIRQPSAFEATAALFRIS